LYVADEALAGEKAVKVSVELNVCSDVAAWAGLD
jgi:hypothetical protein